MGPSPELVEKWSHAIDSFKVRINDLDMVHI